MSGDASIESVGVNKFKLVRVDKALESAMVAHFFIRVVVGAAHRGNEVATRLDEIANFWKGFLGHVSFHEDTGRRDQVVRLSELFSRVLPVA